MSVRARPFLSSPLAEGRQVHLVNQLIGQRRRFDEHRHVKRQIRDTTSLLYVAPAEHIGALEPPLSHTQNVDQSPMRMPVVARLDLYGQNGRTILHDEVHLALTLGVEVVQVKAVCKELLRAVCRMLVSGHAQARPIVAPRPRRASSPARSPPPCAASPRRARGTPRRAPGRASPPRP